MHLKAAAGWIQLGDYDSANDELEKIRAEWRAHPDVLDLRWFIYSHRRTVGCVSGYCLGSCEDCSRSSLTGWVDKALRTTPGNRRRY